MKKKMIGFGLMLLLTTITIYIIMSSEEIVGLPKLINILNPYYILLAIVCMVIYYLLNAVIIYVISKEITGVVTFRASLYLALVGQYYSAITPFASGGQPMQIMTLRNKYNVPIAKATTITVKKFILFHVVVSLLAVVMFFYNLNYIIKEYTAATILLIVIGLLSNLVISVVIIMLAYTDVHIKRMIAILLKLAHKLKLFKKTKIEEVNEHLDEYIKNIDDIKKNKRAMIGLFFLTLVQILFFFTVTFFVYLALGQSGASYLDIISVQILVYMVASFVPTPGNVGASEGGFYVILQPFFQTQYLLYAMAIWRLITYYGLMVFSGAGIALVRFYMTILKRKQVALKSE